MAYRFLVDFVNRLVAWDGWRGRIMATVMARGNADMEIAAVELVNPKTDANVVMIGCGPGVGVVAGARRTPNGMVIGFGQESNASLSSGFALAVGPLFSQ